MHQIDHPPNKILITGNSGSGKSTLATAYALNSRHPLKFVFDAEGEFSQRTQFASVTDLADVDFSSGWVIYDPADFAEEASLETAFDCWATWVFVTAKALNQEAHDDGRKPVAKLAFADELQTIIDPANIPRGLRLLLETGRRQGIDTLLVTQQTNVIHNRARNQITEAVAFSQVDERAVEFLEDLGFESDEVRGLAVGEYVSLQIRSKTWTRGRVFPATGKVCIDSVQIGTRAAMQPAS